MTVEVYEPSDYSLLAEWYAVHGEAVPPSAVLPAWMFKILGSDGAPLLFIGVFRDPSTVMAQINFFVGRPSGPIWDIKRAAIRVWEFFQGFLVGEGVHYVVAQVVDKRLSKAIQRRGFKRVASEVDILAASLK